MPTTMPTTTTTTRRVVARESRARARARATTGTVTARRARESMGRGRDDDDEEKSRSDAFGRAMAAMACAMTMTMTMTPTCAHAFGLNKSGNSDAYAEMMRQTEAARETMSAESLFERGGGACGDGYELRVVKVLGASCVCVSDSCADDEARKERTEYERSFGKGDEASDAPEGGIKFTFATD